MIKKLLVSSSFLVLVACSSSSSEQQELMTTQNAQDVMDCEILGAFNADPRSLSDEQYKQSLNERVLAMHGNAVKLSKLTTAEPEMLSAHVYLCPQ